ncbi:MAG: hypothetical protein ABIE55_00340 [Candidatus Aenigmatarchaeota archaeon]
MNACAVSEEKWDQLGEKVKELDPSFNPCNFNGPCYVLRVPEDNLEKYKNFLIEEAKKLGIEDSISIKSSDDFMRKRHYQIKVSMK